MDLKDVRRGLERVSQEDQERHRRPPARISSVSSSRSTAVNPWRSAVNSWRSYRAIAERFYLAQLKPIARTPLLRQVFSGLGPYRDPQQREYEPRSIPDEKPHPVHLTLS